MAQRGRAAVHVYFFVADADVTHGEHGDTGKSFVYFPQFNVIHAPACVIEHFLNGTNRSHGEVLWLPCVRSHSDDFGDRRLAVFLGDAFAGQNNGGGAI